MSKMHGFESELNAKDDAIAERDATIAGLREELAKARLDEARWWRHFGACNPMCKENCIHKDRFGKLAAEGPQGSALAVGEYAQNTERDVASQHVPLPRTSEPPPAPDWCDVCQAPQMVLPDGSHVCKKPAPEVKHEWVPKIPPQWGVCSCRPHERYFTYEAWQTHVASLRETRPEAQPPSRVNGWDERDYKLWSEIQSLPSFGLVAGQADNPMLSRKDVVRILEQAAEKRFSDAHK